MPRRLLGLLCEPSACAALIKDSAYLLSGFFSAQWLAPYIAMFGVFAHPTVVAAFITGIFVYLARLAEIRFNSRWRERALIYKRELERREGRPYTRQGADDEDCA